MGRKRQLQFGAINITMPVPHSPERYVELFQMAAGLERTTKLQGDWVGRISTVKLETDDGTDLLRGEFQKYIDLDSTRDWFNVRKREPAEKSDLEQISIPDDLKPHFQWVPFVFFPKGHKLVLVTKDGKDNISVNQAKSILETTFADTELVAQFGKIEVVIEPALDTLDKIFSLPRLRTLEIAVTPPNPDDFEEFEQSFLAMMHDNNAGAYQITLQEAGGQGLTPSQQTKNLAKVAQSNGKVTGIGGSHGKTIKLSTTSHPLVEKGQYDPAVELRSSILIQKAKSIFQQLKGN